MLFHMYVNHIVSKANGIVTAFFKCLDLKGGEIQFPQLYDLLQQKKEGKQMIESMKLSDSRDKDFFLYPSKRVSAVGAFDRIAEQTWAEQCSVSEVKDASKTDSLTVQFRTSDGHEGVLYHGKDMLVSVGGKGGTVNAKYDESSTKENPVVVIWGTDSTGKEYKKKVPLNEINPRDASPAEMMALNAHLSKIGNGDVAGPIALWNSLGAANADSKMDFDQYYRDYIAMQRLGGNQSNAELYQFQLERFLFFFQQQK